jgi:phosphate transport system substrate-binding protein
MIAHTRRRSALVATSLLTVALAGGSAAVSAQDAEPMAWPETATGVTGNLEIHGSSTVAPISNAVAEAFVEVNPDLGYVVGDEGTGAGFSDFFCAGASDISDASRAIKDAEVEQCAAAGVEFVELKVAYDGLAVITSTESPIECLTTADLYALMGPESDAVANWKDAQALATELGSTTQFPDAPLSITAPGDESGTYDSFIELVMGDFIEARGIVDDAGEPVESLRSPGDIYVASPNDNVIIEGVAGFPTSLGFVGLAYAEENVDRVKMLGVDAGEGCVVPTSETVSDGTYPIARPLFIYPSLTKMADNAAIAPFVDYYLSDEGIAKATEVGYVALPAEELEATRMAWMAATGR